MAKQRRKPTDGKKSGAVYRYRVDGSAAVKPEIVPRPDPRRGKEGTPPRVQQKKRSRRNLDERKRSELRVRPAEGIAPLSVIGMLLAAVMAVMILQYQVQLNSLNNEVVAAVAELEELQETEDQLQAQYEQLFDMQSIESDMINSGKMISPSESQQIYLELTEEDTSVAYQDEAAVITWLKETLAGLAELFGADTASE